MTRIVTMADSRGGSSAEPVNVPVLSNIVACVLALEPLPDAVMMAGDAVLSWTESNWAVYLQVMQPLLDNGIPYYNCVGNHDFFRVADPYDSYKGTFWAETFYWFPDNGPSEMHGSVYYVDIKDVRIITLNSLSPSIRRIGPDQREWLRSVSGTNAPTAFDIVMQHYPPYSNGVGHEYEGLDYSSSSRDAFWQILNDHKVTLNLCGHDHLYTRRMVDTRYDPRWTHRLPVISNVSGATRLDDLNALEPQPDVAITDRHNFTVLDLDPATATGTGTTYDEHGTILDVFPLQGKHAASGAPQPPTNLAAEQQGSSSVRTTWTDNADDEHSFKIDRRRSGQPDWIRIVELGPDTTSHTDTGLPAATRFYYKVKAWNPAGNSPYSAVSDATTHAEPDAALAYGATWRYRRGTGPPSSPATAWRTRAFDDGAWETGPAAFGYGDGPYGTTLGDMQQGYTTLFLRHIFTLELPAAHSTLQLSTLYDDGFIVWINGCEVARINAPGAVGTQPAYDATAPEALADGTPWTQTYTGSALPGLHTNNVVAVMVLNVGPNSSDLTFDLALTLSSDPLPDGTDADQDGLNDLWEESELQSTGAAPEADPDADGRPNIEEYIIGGDPQIPDRVLAVETVFSNGAVLVQVPTHLATGPAYADRTRCYALDQCTLAGPDAWSVVPGCQRIEATGNPVIYALPAATGAPLRFRARCWLE